MGRAMKADTSDGRESTRRAATDCECEKDTGIVSRSIDDEHAGSVAPGDTSGCKSLVTLKLWTLEYWETGAISAFIHP